MSERPETLKPLMYANDAMRLLQRQNSVEKIAAVLRQRDELAEVLREARKYIYYRGLGTDDVTVYGDNPPFIEAILDPIDALLARIDAKQKEPAK